MSKPPFAELRVFDRGFDLHNFGIIIEGYFKEVVMGVKLHDWCVVVTLLILVCKGDILNLLFM
jgi:hypothetical protein